VDSDSAWRRLRAFRIDTSRDLYPGFDNTTMKFVYFWAHELGRCTNGSNAVACGCAMSRLPALDDSHRSLYHATDSHRWSLLHIAPVLPNGWVFLGESSKWVPTSSTRFTALDASAGSHGVKVNLNCAEAEVVILAALMPAQGDDDSGAAGWVVETVDILCPSSGKTVVCIGFCLM
jgi:hypothetical protein